MKIVHEKIAVWDEMTAATWTWHGIEDIIEQARIIASRDRWVFPLPGSGWLPDRKSMISNPTNDYLAHFAHIDQTMMIFDAEDPGLFLTSERRMFRYELGHVIVLGNCATLDKSFKHDLHLSLQGKMNSIIMTLVHTSNHGILVVDPEDLSKNFKQIAI